MATPPKAPVILSEVRGADKPKDPRFALLQSALKWVPHVSLLDVGKQRTLLDPRDQNRPSSISRPRRLLLRRRH